MFCFISPQIPGTEFPRGGTVVAGSPFLSLFFLFCIKITHIAAEFNANGFRVKSGSKSHVMLLNIFLIIHERVFVPRRTRRDARTR